MRLKRAHLQAIRDHGAREYPHECCGFLVGAAENGGARRVDQVIPAANAHPDRERLRDRFTLDPAEQLRVEREAARRGRGVVGYYHSHPDHPARPSATDREWAWEGYSYVILSVHRGEPGELTSWELVEGEFRPEAVEEVAGG